MGSIVRKGSQETPDGELTQTQRRGEQKLEGSVQGTQAKRYAAGKEQCGQRLGDERLGCPGQRSFKTDQGEKREGETVSKAGHRRTGVILVLIE